MDVKIPKFIKWAGGKEKLLEQYKNLFPKKFNSYYEPFVGGGAVFFYIKQKFQPKNIMISDINSELIDAYKIIRNSPEKLIIELKQHKEYHLSEGKKYYLTIRSTDPKNLPSLERASRFIYLNKTCYNGLYRVNSKGEFNVPMGKYKDPDIIQKEKILFASKLLKNVKIKKMSFEKIINYVKKGDFVYFDPPYYPEKKTSFTKYNKTNFLEEEQKKLYDIFKQLNRKGVFLMLSNSNTDFIKTLYKDYNIHFVNANRMINSDSKNRGKIKELVITNYKVNF